MKRGGRGAPPTPAPCHIVHKGLTQFSGGMECYAACVSLKSHPVGGIRVPVKSNYWQDGRQLRFPYTLNLFISPLAVNSDTADLWPSWIACAWLYGHDTGGIYIGGHCPYSL